MVDPNIKKLFPEKTDDEILYKVYNPCQLCEFYYCDDDCHECVLGRLWDFFEAHQPKTPTANPEEFNDYNIALNG